MMNADGSQDSRARRSLRFTWLAAWQVLTQAVNITTGILITRLLPKQEFAWLAIGNSAVASFSTLTEGGGGLGIQSLGTRLWQDAPRFRSLLATALAFRWRLSLLAALASLPLPLWLLLRNHASFWTAALLLVACTVGFPAMLGAGILGAALKLQGRFREALGTDLLAAVARLLLVGAAAAALWLDAITAALIASLMFVLQNRLLWKSAGSLVHDPAGISREHQEGINRQLRALLPNGLFQILQGHLCVWLLSFTTNVSAVADYSALNRLGSFFAIVSSLSYQLVIPALSRCHAPQILGARLLIFFAGYSAVAAASILGGWLGADWVLLLFGPAYSHLAAEVPWMFFFQSLYAFSMILWWFNTSRGWTRTAWLIPVVTLTIQAAALAILRPDTVMKTIFFSIATVAPSILLGMAACVRGVRSTPPAAA